MSHVVPTPVYYRIFAILLALTALTVGAAFLDMGRANDLVALGIATAKALLVILFFMHLRYSPHLSRLVLATGCFWFAVLILLTMSDIVTRGVLGVPGK